MFRYETHAVVFPDLAASLDQRQGAAEEGRSGIGNG